jgi:hypothetical protein
MMGIAMDTRDLMGITSAGAAGNASLNFHQQLKPRVRL